MNSPKKNFAVIDRSGKILLKMSAKKAQTVVKKFARNKCPKRQQRCQLTVHILDLNTGNVKIYRFMSRKIKPKTIMVQDGSYKVKRSIKVIYANSYKYFMI